jgi:hypothetical protein
MDNVQNINTHNCTVLKGSDDGVMHFEESLFMTLSIVQCFSLKTKFRKLALFPSSGKKGEGLAPTLWGRPPFLPEDGSRVSFRNVVFEEKHWTMDKVLKRDPSKHIIATHHRQISFRCTLQRSFRIKQCSTVMCVGVMFHGDISLYVHRVPSRLRNTCSMYFTLV